VIPEVDWRQTGRRDRIPVARLAGSQLTLVEENPSEETQGEQESHPHPLRGLVRIVESRRAFLVHR